MRDSSSRDADQVLSKWWTKNHCDDESVPRAYTSDSIFDRMRDAIASAKGTSDQTSGARSRKPHLDKKHRDDSAKVLMIDEMWCWVVDKGADV